MENPMIDPKWKPAQSPHEVFGFGPKKDKEEHEKEESNDNSER